MTRGSDKWSEEGRGFHPPFVPAMVLVNVKDLESLLGITFTPENIDKAGSYFKNWVIGKRY